jgi:hypothetical protein
MGRMIYFIEREEDAKRRRAHHLEKGGTPLGKEMIAKCDSKCCHLPQSSHNPPHGKLGGVRIATSFFVNKSGSLY